MIKIDNVSFINKWSNIELKEKNVLNKSSNNYLSPDYVMKNMPQAHLISFKGTSEYEKTLKDNFFQLPEGAKPDSYQEAAAKNIYAGNDVIVTAPTGTGKTAIAHYAITKNLKEGGKTFYTTPLKALSNEKFKDFQNIYGKENVGLLTGDVKLNVHAPVVIMTTEVYRNMVFGDNFAVNGNNMSDNLKTVVFDELHYLGDVDRGGIWEQSIILSKPETQLLSLSATIGNNKDVSKWMTNLRNHNMEVISGTNKELENYQTDKSLQEHTVLVNVPQENRHVPLEFKNIHVDSQKADRDNKKKSDKKSQTYPMKPSERFVINNESYRHAVEQLKKEDKLPAIFFIFSKKGSKEVINHLGNKGPMLTNKKEKTEIDYIIREYRRNGKFLGESMNMKALWHGYAVHNSGLLPAQKELIEELFQKKLVKVVIATETLSAGINMPTRTTVITATRKPSSTPDGVDGKRDMTPNEFHQMAGRAGRRGIDTRGYCYTLSVDEKQKQKFENLVESPPNNLESSFKPDYSFIANYYDNCDNDDIIKELFEKSFYAYDEDPQAAKQNSYNLLNIFNNRKKVLNQLNYISSNNTLTDKGRLLSKLNGYEQLPIIEMVHNKAFANMNAIETAATIGTLANLQKAYDSERKNKEAEIIFQHENEKIENFIDKTDNLLEICHKMISKINPETTKIEANKYATRHIYEFANENSKNPKSRGNWIRLYSGPLKNTIRDEGTLFKEMTASIDLLKQIRELTLTGKSNAGDNSEEFNYYHQLKQNIDEAIDLLSRPPVVEEAI